MESANVVINDEQCAETLAEEAQSVRQRSIEVEDSLPKEYVEKSTNEELLILNDTVSKQTTPIRETPQEHDELSTPFGQNTTTTSLVKGTSARVKLNHDSKNILGSLNDNMRLRSKALNVITHSYYLSQVEPKKVNEALQDADWINSMHEELHQFVRNEVWELVLRP